jgi:glycogen debranching enzyme
MVNLAETVVIKNDNVFAVTERDGAVPLERGHALGIYYDDCRFVSGHELRLNGSPLRLLVASAQDGTASLHELTNPTLALADGRELPLQSLRIRFERALGAGGATERIEVHSHHRERVEVVLEVRVAAGFEPMFALRGIVDAEGLDGVAGEAADGGLRFARTGRDGVERTTLASASPAPAVDAASGTLRFEMSLEPGGTEVVDIRLGFAQDGVPPTPPAERALARATRIVSDDELFNRVLERSVLDLRTLHSTLDGRGYYAAGVPWFATLFGRDSLITALEMLAFDPGIAEDTLRLLASLVGRRDDPVHEEQPGKVLHELRVGEVAATGESPLTRYYGSVDATALFVCLLCEHAHWTGSLALLDELREPLEAMLGWLDGAADADGDGLIDYRAAVPEGLRNQGWKDSGDGICDEHGVPLEPPIALCEAQGYAIRARRELAALLDFAGEEARAGELRGRADALAARLERLWLADLGFYAMALDGDGRASRALASNQGHLLWSRAVPGDRGESVRDALMDDRSFSGWGIRTLAAGQPAYNPVGYHLGTVWPHDTAIAAIGLRDYGFDEDFLTVYEGLLEAAATSPDYRLPELFAGFSRSRFAEPVPYPVACHPQAWAAGALPALLTCGLGLVPDALAGRLRVRRPTLPGWVDRVEVAGLCVGDSTVDLLFERSASGGVALTDARIEGDVEVVLEISAARGAIGTR